MGMTRNEGNMDQPSSSGQGHGTDPGLVAALDSLPHAAAAFAYGSGVFHQPGLYQGTADGTGPMLDFILAVDDPRDWHAENLALNPAHYSCYAALGPAAVAWAADTVGAGIYFNTLVPIGDRMVKYGVVSRSALLRDLRTWDALYCAGRLHKPVAWLPHSKALPPDIAAATEANLVSALRVAGLLLPMRFDDAQLLRTLCALSYAGDVRMGWAEDPAKLDRIVNGQGRALRQLYAPALAAAEAEGRLERDPGEPDSWHRVMPGAGVDPASMASLPAALAARLGRLLGAPGPEALTRVFEAEPRQAAGALRSALAGTVRASSARQAALGLLSAGLLKSGRYGLAKLGKAWRSRR